MALSDPQSVTINGVATSLPNVSREKNASGYANNDGTVKLEVSHSYGNRDRRLIRLTHSKVAPDAYLTDRNVELSMSSYMVFDTPAAGYTVAEAKYVVDALVAYLAASSGAVVTKLLGGES